MSVPPTDLPLERAYRWERERAGQVFLTQPYGGGQLREWTWAQAMGEARRMAAYLKAQGWAPGSRIAILSKNCAWSIMSDLAIWMAGHVSVPVYPSLRAQSIQQILEHSGAAACYIGATDERDTAGKCTLPEVVWIAFPNAAEGGEIGWEALVEANAPLPGCPVRPAGDLATIIYTSGTTGAPKGVMHSFGSFAYNARILSDHLGLGSEQRILSYLPLAHIVERAGVEANALLNGWHLFFTEGVDTFLEDLRRARPTLFISVPRLFLKFQQGVLAKIPGPKLERLLRMPILNYYVKRRILRQLGLNTAKYAACGAAPLPIDLLAWYRRLGLNLVEGYGMTETMITHLPHPDAVRPGYVGSALPGVETRLGDQDELLVRSPMNLMGYFRDARMTAEAFTADGFFKTGDKVLLDFDNQVKIVGRIKDQFKTSKGKYVVPAPIEGRLMEHPVVEACCLMGSGQPSPVALVILSDSAREKCVDPEARREIEESLRARMEAINAELEPFERLSTLIVTDGPWTVANGLITPTLKIRRGTLEAQYSRKIDEWRERNLPVVWESEPARGADAYVARAAGANSLRHSDVPPSQT